LRVSNLDYASGFLLALLCDKIHKVRRPPQVADLKSVMATILPVILFVVLATLLSIALLMPAKLLAPRRRTAVKQMPYESGMDPVHDTRRRFDVRFHLVAIAFLVFDVELLFLYPWAVASRPHGEGPGIAGAAGRPLVGIDSAVAHGLVQSRGLVFGEVMVFIGLLALGFVYVWRKGVFRWR
jgi:NADH-quinone oxidoreductase subunit A